MKSEIRKTLAQEEVLASPVAEPTLSTAEIERRADAIVAEQKAIKEAAPAKVEPETEAQFIERRLREENTERFRKEFAQSEVLRKRREITDAENAKELAARERRESINKASWENRQNQSKTVTCEVCGSQNVPEVAVSHVVWGTDDKCIRKPRVAKASGLLTQDQWDDLSPEEIKNGYV